MGMVKSLIVPRAEISAFFASNRTTDPQALQTFPLPYTNLLFLTFEIVASSVGGRG